MTVMPRERLAAAVFVAPAVLLIGAFVVWPVADMALGSFQRRGWSRETQVEPAGWSNYGDVLQDRAFRTAVRNTAVFTLWVVPLQTLAALGFALWCNGPGFSRRFLRLCVFVPTTVSLTVLAVLWKLMYEPASAGGAGLINGLLMRAGLPPQPFLTSREQALPAIIAMSVWQGAGLQMMVFLAGLQGIPPHLYEAAKLDGAGRWRRFLHVTLPGVAPTAVFVVMITTIFALKLFVQPYLMTRGGPDDATLSVVQFIYRAAFRQRDLGLAYAAGILFFTAVAVVAVVQRVLSRRAERLT